MIVPCPRAVRAVPDVLGRAAPLFAAGGFRAIELGVADIVELQRFFDENPEYFVTVTGQRPHAAEAHDEIHRELPEGWSFTKKWAIGFVDESGSLVGMADIVSDLLAPHVWHIGLFIVATRLHGAGVAQLLYASLERWARDHGAQWLRLGVVEGNERAERFWQRCAFAIVRTRDGVQMGPRTHTIRVMYKPLAGGSLQEYLALVARDRPDAS
jgi:GNAT superfamily N-acetyltransferase